MLGRGWWKAWTFIALTLAAMALSGCIRIQVVDRTPSSVSVSPLTDKELVEEHGLAVLAVDFDPPLVYEEILSRRNRGEGITLLVAVENTGAHTEQDVHVEVELSRDDDDDAAFLQKQGSIEALAPGEIRIVQFRDTNVPFSYAYLLRVRVVPVAGETRLTDNQKTYDLLISQP